MECLSGTQLHKTFKKRAIVAVKLRGIKTPQSTLRQESGVEVATEGRGVFGGGVKSGYTSYIKPALFVSRNTPVPDYSLMESRRS